MKFLNKLLIGILTIVLFGFIIFIIKSNILPIKYIILIGIIYFIIYVILVLRLSKKRKKGKKNQKRIFTKLFCIIFIIFNLFLIYFFNTTDNFLEKIISDNIEYEHYYVITNSNYKNVSEIKNKAIYLYGKTEFNYNKAIQELNKKIKVNIKEYNKFDTLINDFCNQKIDLIIVNNLHKHLIEEKYNDFNIVYEITLKNKRDDVSKNIDVTNKSFNIFISGIDVSGNISSVSRSDVNIIMTVNPVKKEVLLTSIPRDYYVSLSTNRKKDKLTHASLYGIDCSIKTIENLLDIDINYYVKVNFTTLVKVIDIIGNIDVSSDYTFTTEDGKYIKKGINIMNGETALSFSRERHAFSDGDRIRGINQKKVIQAIINKVTTDKNIVMKYKSILDKLSGTFETNMEQKNITNLIKLQLDAMNKWEIKLISLDGNDSYNYTYSIPNTKLYVMTPNNDTVSNASNIINNITKNGKNFSELKIEED